MSDNKVELKADAKSLRDIAYWTKLVEMEFKRIGEEVRRKEARVTSEMLYQIADRLESGPSSGDARVLEELEKWMTGELSKRGMAYTGQGEALKAILAKLSELRTTAKEEKK